MLVVKSLSRLKILVFEKSSLGINWELTLKVSKCQFSTILKEEEEKAEFLIGLSKDNASKYCQASGPHCVWVKSRDSWKQQLRQNCLCWKSKPKYLCHNSFGAVRQKVEVPEKDIESLFKVTAEAEKKSEI